MPRQITAAIDHLVYAVPELTAGVQVLADRCGVTAAAGGRHEGRGSHNALLALGAEAYLEVIAPDPDQPPPPRPHPFGLGSLTGPRLITFAVHEARPDDTPPLPVPPAAGRPAPLRHATAGHRLDRWRAQAVARGYQPGPAAAMSRRRPDGTLLRWRLCQHAVPPFGGVVPFLIDWGDAESPAASAPAGCRLLELEVTTPEVEAVGAALRALGVAVRVRAGDRPALRATLATPRGTVELT